MKKSYSKQKMGKVMITTGIIAFFLFVIFIFTDMNDMINLLTILLFSLFISFGFILYKSQK